MQVALQLSVASLGSAPPASLIKMVFRTPHAGYVKLRYFVPPNFWGRAPREPI